MSDTLFLTRYTVDPEEPSRIVRREEVGRLVLQDGCFRVGQLDNSVDRARLQQAITDVEASGVWALGSAPAFKESEEGARSHAWIRLSPHDGRAYLIEFGRSLSDRLSRTSLSSLRAHPSKTKPISALWSTIICSGTGLSLLIILTIDIRTWSSLLLGLAMTEALTSACGLAYALKKPRWLLRLLYFAVALNVSVLLVYPVSLIGHEMSAAAWSRIMSQVSAAGLHDNSELPKIAAGLIAAGLALYGAYVVKLRELRVCFFGAALVVSGSVSLFLAFSWLVGIIAN